MSYNILFLNTYKSYPGVRDYSNCDFYGTSQLVSFIENHGYKAKLIVENTANISQTLINEFKINNIKIIGLYCDFYNQTEVISISSYIKKKYNIIIIVGGPQAFALNKNFIIQSNCDLIIRGEAEIPLLEILNFYIKKKGSLKNIKGITYINDLKKVIKNPDQEIINNLDELPFPNIKNIINYNFNKKNAPLITGRGCPFSCAFCFESNNTKNVRYRSINNVIDEIKYIFKERKNARYITILDDTFTLKPERVNEFCQEINKLRKKRNFVWYCTGHVNILSRYPELIPMMIESGLVRLQIGIESGSQEILDQYNKKITLAEIEFVIRESVRNELPQIIGNIIVGGVNETNDTIEDSKKFSKKILEIAKGILDLNTAYFWPFPNTPITNNPNKFGIEILDYNSFTSVEDYPVVKTIGLSKEEICFHKIDLNKIICNKMFDLVYKIPYKNIYKQFELNYKYDIKSNWYNILYQITHIKQYFTLLLNGGFVRSANIDEKKLLNYYPMRLIQITQHKNDRIIINNIVLSILETEVIRYSAGRITTRHIIDILYLLFKNKNISYLTERESNDNFIEPPYIKHSNKLINKKDLIPLVINILKNFEKKYYIIFSIF